MEEFLRFIKAVRDGDFEKVKVLANEKIINNPSGDGGDTALHIATYAGFTQVVKNLLEIKGVKVDTVNKTGETALHLASSLGDSQIVEVLLKMAKQILFWLIMMVNPLFTLLRLTDLYL